MALNKIKFLRFIGLVLIIMLFCSLLSSMATASFTSLVAKPDWNGNWVFTAVDPAGGNNDTYYLTTGWVINTGTQCTDPTNNTCYPLKGPHIVFEYNKKIQTNEIYDGSGNVYTEFSVNIDEVDKAFSKIGLGGYIYKNKVYINSIFHIYHPQTGTIDATPYYTPQDVVAARNWSAIGTMGQYYDIETTIPPRLTYPVEAICSLPDGTTLPCNTKSKLNDSGLYTNKIGDFKKGDPVSWTFPFELTSNGTTYQLQQSYITPHDDLQQQTMSVPASQTMTRNITADNGGNYIVGVYKPKSSVTVTATINGPTEVDDTVTDVDATFTFEAKSTNLDLDHYQITDTQNCDFVRTADKSGKLTGKDDGKAGLPIKIHMGTGPNIKCSITVKAFDVGPGSDQTTAQHSVVKASQPAAPQASGCTDLNPNPSGKIGADPSLHPSGRHRMRIYSNPFL